MQVLERRAVADLPPEHGESLATWRHTNHGSSQHRVMWASLTWRTGTSHVSFTWSALSHMSLMWHKAPVSTESCEPHNSWVSVHSLRYRITTFSNDLHTYNYSLQWHSQCCIRKWLKGAKLGNKNLWGASIILSIHLENYKGGQDSPRWFCIHYSRPSVVIFTKCHIGLKNTFLVWTRKLPGFLVTSHSCTLTQLHVGIILYTCIRKWSWLAIIIILTYCMYTLYNSREVVKHVKGEKGC